MVLQVLHHCIPTEFLDGNNLGQFVVAEYHPFVLRILKIVFLEIIPHSSHHLSSRHHISSNNICKLTRELYLLLRFRFSSIIILLPFPLFSKLFFKSRTVVNCCWINFKRISLKTIFFKSRNVDICCWINFKRISLKTIFFRSRNVDICCWINFKRISLNPITFAWNRIGLAWVCR